MIEPKAREEQAAALLEAWPWELGGVLIGGYAAAAYGAPRYSDDLDIVVPTDALPTLIPWIENEQGFTPDRVPKDLQQNYAGKVARWRRDGLTLDVLPGAVRDREALIDVPESWIANAPRRERLVLLHTRLAQPIPVARPEAFWALKLQAGRSRDLADLFAARHTTVDLDEVRRLFEEYHCGTLQAKLSRVRKSLEDPKLFRDALSRLAMGSPADRKNRREWERFRSMVHKALPSDAFTTVTQEDLDSLAEEMAPWDAATAWEDY